MVLPVPWHDYSQAAEGSCLLPSAEAHSRKDAHETILTALEQICTDSGLTTCRHNIPAVKKSKCKLGRGDLVIKDAHLGGQRDLVSDVVCTLEFGGGREPQQPATRP